MASRLLAGQPLQELVEELGLVLQELRLSLLLGEDGLEELHRVQRGIGFLCFEGEQSLYLGAPPVLRRGVDNELAVVFGHNISPLARLTPGRGC
jgi:hypothetical protein